MSKPLILMSPFSNFKKIKSNKWTYLYALYIGIDNGKLSLSMIKYSFEILLTNSDLATKAMQEWMSSPQGAAITLLSILGAISFSLIANFIEKDEIKKFNGIIVFWPYARDSLKCLRNGLRGIGSTLNLIYILDLKDLRHLVVPLGIFVGFLSVISRIWIRYKSNRYCNQLEINAKLLNDLKQFNNLTLEQIEQMRTKIGKQTKFFKTCSIIACVLSGLIDGINPYIGSLVLVTFSPSMLLLVSTFCSVYFFSILAIRIHEELNLQHELLIAERKVELHLQEKEIALLTHSIIQLNDHLTSFSSYRDRVLDEYITLSIYLNSQLEAQENQMQELSQLNHEIPTWIRGIKNGLNIYKYLMLTFSTCIFLSPIKLPSLTAEHRALLGMSTLSAGIIYSFSPSFLRQWMESIKTYFKAKDDYENNSIPLTKPRLSCHNTNGFFSAKKSRELVLSSEGYTLTT